MPVGAGKSYDQRALWFNVKNCARCGGEHDHVLFIPLNGNDTYTHFAMCDLVRKPILLHCYEHVARPLNKPPLPNTQ